MAEIVVDKQQGFVEIPEVLDTNHTLESVTNKISNIPLTPTLPRPIIGVGLLAMLLLGSLMTAVGLLLVKGTGVWGINQPVGWGFAIINFVWWIGIGHAGTLISAILLLLRQEWRTSINRFAETMTIFAVMCAGIFPLLHVGRPWLAYWLFPYPNVMQMWPQFRSPLIWDVVAVSTYATVSILFWFTGLIPDLATLRDRAKGKIAKIGYGMASMGWRGSAKHWQRYEIAYLLLAGLSTPLVVSVHSIVGLDFAVSVIPGWHVTIFPPYFVAGAIFSGFAMVLTLAIPLRALFGWKDMITLNHLNNISKVMLATCLMVLYGYGMEVFFAWYSASEYEGYMKFNRMYGPYWWSYWSLILCNGVVPQLLWIKKVRTSPAMLFVISIIANIGMWLERFVIVITSLHRDFLPSSWGMFTPTWVDWAMYLGTIGMFLFLMTLAIKFLPMISQFEVRELLHKKQHKH
ncbi:MAG: NrfD/PsrC family molybdoenzyme membrane anchor subunit [Kiritimatiellia bacterium]|jgi:Ni/Fe-hydrogenase subunit HybB-like protein